MTSLKISFGPYSSKTGDAIVPLEIFDRNMERVLAAPMQLDKGYDADVSPGSYLVRVLLPSGELLTDHVNVAEDTPTPVNVQLDPLESSPQEDLAWAYYLQNPTNSVPTRSIMAHSEGLEQFEAPLKINVRLFARRRDEWVDVSDTSKFLLNHSIRFQDTMALLEIKVFSNPNELVWVWLGGGDAPSRVVALPPPSEEDPDPVRAILYRDLSTNPDPLNVVVKLASPEAQSLLTFLAQGKLAAASIIGPSYLEQAERLLRDKFTDPIAAAAGGYFLLRAAKVDGFHDWIKNLDEYFPWMPDGAIIHAAHLLQQDSPDVELARSRYLEGENRGLPIFTQGLRSLFDGLSALSRRRPAANDVEVEAALRRLTPYAAAADWRAVVTTFFGEHPGKPSPFLPKSQGA